MRGRYKPGAVIAALGAGILLALILPTGFFVFLLGLALVGIGLLICRWR